MPDAEGKPLVYVVDDEEHITELVAMALTINEMTPVRLHSGNEALARIAATPPDLMILDVMLPGTDGFGVAKRLRRVEGEGTQVPIIFLTARDATSDKVEGLQLGVDDYVTKPFSIEELMERVKAVLRRSGRLAAAGRHLVFEDLELDEDSREVRRHGEIVELTPTEYKLLHYLLENAKRVLTREELLAAVWEYTFTSNASVLETYISYLRQKVDAVDPPLIQTVRGVGYCLRLPRSAPARTDGLAE